MPWKVPTLRPRVPVSSESSRPRISPAALLVKVTARIAHGGTRSTSTSQAMRWVSTRVLPEPAPASTRYEPGGALTASRCAAFSESSKCETSIGRIVPAARRFPLSAFAHRARDHEGRADRDAEIAESGGNGFLLRRLHCQGAQLRFGLGRVVGEPAERDPHAQCGDQDTDHDQCCAHVNSLGGERRVILREWRVKAISGFFSGASRKPGGNCTNKMPREPGGSSRGGVEPNLGRDSTPVFHSGR